MNQAQNSTSAMIGQINLVTLLQSPHLPPCQAHLLVEDLLSLNMTKDLCQTFIIQTAGLAQETIIGQISVRVTLLLGLVG